MQEEETIEKIVLSVPTGLLKKLQEYAEKEGITVKQYMLGLAEQDVKRRSGIISPGRLADILKQNSELSRQLRESQERFDLLTKAGAEATVKMIDAKLAGEAAAAAEIQKSVLPRIAAEKEMLLSDIRRLILDNDAKLKTDTE